MPKVETRIVNKRSVSRVVPDRAPEPMTGIGLIKAERQRQVEREGYTAEHDDRHGPDELMEAAEAYRADDAGLWPWHPSEFKRKDRRSDLIRAGALMLAAQECANRLGDIKTEAVARGFVASIAGEIDRLPAKA